jgi:hypothetical protein
MRVFLKPNVKHFIWRPYEDVQCSNTI